MELGEEPLSLEERVRAIVAAEYGVPMERVTPETHFYTDLDDSLELVCAVAECERAFGVDIPDEEAMELERVADLISLIRAKREAS